MDATAWATFWVFLALLVLVGLMFYLGVPGKIIGALDARGEKIRQELADAARLRDEAKALLAEYQRRRGEAVAEAEAIIDQARREADVMAQEARERLEDYVDAPYQGGGTADRPGREPGSHRSAKPRRRRRDRCGVQDPRREGGWPGAPLPDRPVDRGDPFQPELRPAAQAVCSSPRQAATRQKVRR